MSQVFAPTVADIGGYVLDFKARMVSNMASVMLRSGALLHSIGRSIGLKVGRM